MTITYDDLRVLLNKSCIFKLLETEIFVTEINDKFSKHVDNMI